MGYVPQKGVLFCGDHRQSNLKFGAASTSPTRTCVPGRRALPRPPSLSTPSPRATHSPIAQGGTNVSGGQKQRLSIARAIAKKPRRCYLFDDSFSALDYKTDVVLPPGPERRRQTNATVIIVAQRISTIAPRRPASWCWTRAASWATVPTSQLMKTCPDLSGNCALAALRGRIGRCGRMNYEKHVPAGWADGGHTAPDGRMMPRREAPRTSRAAMLQLLLACIGQVQGLADRGRDALCHGVYHILI